MTGTLPWVALVIVAFLLACIAVFVVLALRKDRKVYAVSDKDEKDIPGIPFFSHAGVCRNEQSWIETLAQVRLLEVPARGKPQDAQQIGAVVLRDLSKINKLREVLGDSIALHKRFVELEGTSENPYAEFNPDDPRQKSWYVEIGRTARPESVVDYAKPLYFNASRPLIGSADVATELNNDGTLSKGSAKAEDKTLETLTSLLPIKELLTAGVPAKVPDEGKRAEAAVVPPPMLLLEITPLVFKHTRFKYTELKTALWGWTKPAPDDQYIREQLLPAPPQAAPKPAESKPEKSKTAAAKAGA